MIEIKEYKCEECFNLMLRNQITSYSQEYIYYIPLILIQCINYNCKNNTYYIIDERDGKIIFSSEVKLFKDLK